MKTSIASLARAVCLLSSVSAVSLVSATAWCDEPSDARTDKPDENADHKPEAKKDPKTDATAAHTTPPRNEARSGCSLRFHGGLDQGPAQTAANVVCDEIRAAGGTGSYVVDLEKLESKVILRVSDEGSGGQTLDSRRVILASLDEVPNAAPRVAKALVENKALSDTANVSNLLGEETTKAKKKSGEFLWGVGLLGLVVPTVSSQVSTGAEFPFLYEGSDFAVGGSFRFAVNSRDEGGSQVALSIGGRQFFQPTNTSFFWGGGMSIEWLSLSTKSATNNADYTTYSGNGAALYGELGVETMRFHRSRLLAAIRVDVPLFKPDHETTDWQSGASPRTVTSTQYAIPMTFNVTYMW